MGSKLKGILLCLAIFLLLFNTWNPLGAASVKFVEEIKISPNGEPLQDVWSFCVTDDEIFILPDQKAGNIKVYEKNGNFLNLVNVVGRKGFREGEFQEPSYCFFNKNASTFGVLDEGRRKVLVFDRIERKELVYFREVDCRALGYDIHLIGQKLVVSGYKADQNGKPYHLYYVDVLSGNESFLLPSYYKYGLKSFGEYKTEYREKPDIKAIGLNGFFDVQGEDIFFVWEGNLRVIKLNINSKELTFFGKQLRNYYKRPHGSKELLGARHKRDFKRLMTERKKMSYVRQIFATPKHVIIVYEKRDNHRLQLYTLDGKFLKDLPVPGKPDNRMWFNEEQYILYSLDAQSLKSNRKEYRILKYRLER